jgi:hypothetical protein
VFQTSLYQQGSRLSSLFGKTFGEAPFAFTFALPSQLTGDAKVKVNGAPPFVEPELNSWFSILFVFSTGLRAKPALGFSWLKTLLSYDLRW